MVKRSVKSDWHLLVRADGMILITRTSIWLSSVLLCGLIYLADTVPVRSVSDIPLQGAIQLTGYAVLYMLVISLTITPISRYRPRWINKKWYYHFRRESGIAAGILSVLHGLFSLDAYFQWQWWLLSERAWIISGMLASLILLLMLMTSPYFVQRKLKKKMWILIHQGVYLAAILVICHITFSSHATLNLNRYLSLGLLSLLLHRLIVKLSLCFIQR